MSLVSFIRKRVSKLLRYVYPVPATFDHTALESREKYRSDYKVLAGSISSNLSFHSVMDIGCAQGLLLNPLYESGYDVYGVEVSDDAIDFLPDELANRVTIGDFSDVSGSFDLVCCIEVAEHIKPSRSEELVAKICGISSQYVFFTAAPPGQKGHGHINCRPHDYWVSLFRDRNFKVLYDVTNNVKKDLKTVDHVDWIMDNCFVLEKYPNINEN